MMPLKTCSTLRVFSVHNNYASTPAHSSITPHVVSATDHKHQNNCFSMGHHPGSSNHFIPDNYM